jgi:YesN/AraC family two-component response regulator
LYKTFFILKINYWSVKTNQPFTYDFSLVKSWTKFLFTIQVIYLSIFIFSKTYDIFYKNYSCNFYFEFILLIIYSSVYFKIIFSPVIFYGNPSLFKRIESTSISKFCVTDVWNIKVVADSMSSKEQLLYYRIENNIIDYIEQIEEIALKNFAFRKPDYSLYQLSIEIGVPKYYLDFIFKYHCKVSFVEYKKIVRIYDSIQLINSGYLKTNKLDTLSKYVGYSSYNPFLVNFKELTGSSPFEFYRNRKITKKC